MKTKMVSRKEGLALSQEGYFRRIADPKPPSKISGILFSGSKSEAELHEQKQEIVLFARKNHMVMAAAPGTGHRRSKSHSNLRG